MRLFGHEVTGVPKALTILAAVLLVATGLCGMQLLVSRGGDRLTSVLLLLGIAELIVILLSAAGIVLVLIFWGVRGLYRVSERRRPDGEEPSSAAGDNDDRGDSG